MNLKYIETNWDKELFFVIFQIGKKKLRWYPRWEDLRYIIEGAVITESHIADEHPLENQRGPELDNFRSHFQEMTAMIDYSRSEQ